MCAVQHRCNLPGLPVRLPPNGRSDIRQIAPCIEISKIPREQACSGRAVSTWRRGESGYKKFARRAGTPPTPLFRFAFFENSTHCPRTCPQDLWTTMNRRTRVNHVYEKAKRRV